ncbi:winged helix-turn-helix transcriptional regulator [Streptomyces sp. NPDC101152]|uniref:winged helix-turn-helix transcriptional regulator n=1 Tax=Streptomyces sp. NPDC101152 TaxID=3366116 RepID=UPI00382F3BB2
MRRGVEASAPEREAWDESPLQKRQGVRHEYHLTDKGEAFTSVPLALRAWGEAWCKEPGEGVAVHYIHQTCGREVGLSGTVREGCGEPFTMNEATVGNGWGGESRCRVRGCPR